jgi:outer membrane biosynthesis protein TonB
VREGELFSVPAFKYSRYFLSAEARDAATPAVRAHLAAEQAARDQLSLERARERDRQRGPAKVEKDRARRAALRAANQKPPKVKAEKPPKPPKPVNAKPPKAAKPPKPAKQPKAGKDLVVPSDRPKQTAPKWKDMPVVIPPTVKVQKLPGYKPRTFEPPQWFKGDLLREWAELRGQS